MTPRYDAGRVSVAEGVDGSVEPLREWVLAWFPEGAHPLTLVRDPDGLLADEMVLAALAARGFRLIAEADPIVLRFQIEATRPWTADRPLVVRTEGRLNELPYDVWRPGHKVELGLHAYFPLLDYPSVRQLGPLARARLSRAPQPAQVLGPISTAEHLLRHVYLADVATLRQPATLLTWLADYHAWREPMPAPLARRLAEHLGGEPAYAGWDLQALLADPDSLQAFVSTEWSAFLGGKSRLPLGEAGAAYVIDFQHDPAVQDAVSRLVRSGALTPVQVAELTAVEQWARPGVTVAGSDDTIRRFDLLSDNLDEALRSDLREAHWANWCAVARDWAALQAIHDAPNARLPAERRARLDQIALAIDTQFAAWLPSHYAALATLGLPAPHHVFQVPGYLAFDWRNRPVDRIALLVLDGLALRDWTLIAPVWRRRHANWTMREGLVLAEAPTITSISRQALISGLRPAHFAKSLETNRFEPKQWASFWARQEPALLETACPYVRLWGGTDRVSFGSRERAVCLIENSIDDIVHGATLGASDVQASLALWLETEALQLEQIIAELLEQQFRVYLASDHGHVEAEGTGTISDGVSAETRGKRARVYRDPAVAERARVRMPDTDIWSDDGLLPDDALVLMPRGRAAFAPVGERVVTHGGTTLDELVVPFISIEGQR